MGLIQYFKNLYASNQVKSLEKSGDVLKKLLTTKDQRLEALESIESADPKLAIPQLMKRFEMTIDHGIQDKIEKERVLDFFLKHREIAKEALLEKIPALSKISWLLRCSERLFSPEEYMQILLRNLRDEYVGFDDAAQERNIEILLALKEIQNDAILERVRPFVNSRDPEVRMAAIECLETQAQKSVEARQIILELSQMPKSADNSRFLGVLQSIVQKNAWT